MILILLLLFKQWFFSFLWTMFASRVGLLRSLVLFRLFFLVIIKRLSIRVGVRVRMLNFRFFMESIFDNLKKSAFNKKMNVTKYINNSSDNTNNHWDFNIIRIKFSIVTLTVIHLFQTDIDSDNIGQC